MIRKSLPRSDPGWKPVFRLLEARATIFFEFVQSFGRRKQAEKIMLRQKLERQSIQPEAVTL
jgi:hypothetical protein